MLPKVQEWKILSTEEEKALYLEKIQRSMYPSLAELRDTLRLLWDNPLARVDFLWRAKGHTALSPFALAGITKHPPKEVLAQLEKEPGRKYIFFCGHTHLPVVEFKVAWDTVGIINTYDERMQRYFEGGEAARREGLDYAVGYGDFPYEARTFEALLDRCGGASWRRHCTRFFDPFKVGRRNVLSEEDWKDLREAYLGRELRRKKEVKP